MSRFRFTPLVLTVVGYILGILLGNLLVGTKYSWFLISFLIFLILALLFYFVLQQISGNIALILSILAFLCLGIGCHLKARAIPFREISRYVSMGGEKNCRLFGVVVSIPREAPQRLDFVLACEKLTIDGKEIEVTGRTQVFLYTSEPQEINYGDRLSLSGRLSFPHASTNPGLFDYRKYLGYQKIYSLFSVYKSEDIERLEKVGMGIFRLAISRIRQRVDSAIKRTLPQLESSVLAGVMMGERASLPKEVHKIFDDAGVLHTLSVSGLHVGLVLFIFYGLFRAIGIPKKTTYFLTIFLVIIYSQVVGGCPPAVRAAIMATCGLLAFILGREGHLYNSLALAALIILLFNPFTLFDIGFQLSFMATLGILYLTPHFHAYFRFGKPNKYTNYISTSLAISAGALVGVYPITAFYFNKISLVAIISNILVVPLVGLIIALGFASSILNLFSFWLAQVTGTINELFIAILIKTIGFFASFRLSFKYVISPSLIFMLAYYLFFALLPRTEYSRSIRKFLLFFPLIFLLVVTGKKLFPGKLSINFLDVGQGDAIHIRLPDRRNILIDGGGGMGKFDIGERILVPYLFRNGVSRIDALFLTHPHYNHIGGLIPVLRKFKVRRVYYNGQNYEDHLLQEFYKIIEEKRVSLKYLACGEKLDYNAVKFHILNPQTMGEDIDSNSLVMRLSYGKFGILFSGDIDFGIQEELAKVEIEKNDILQIPNHGGTPISPKFLYKAGAKYGIISTKSQLNKLGKRFANMKFFSTAEDGAINISTDGESFVIRTTKEGE